MDEAALSALWREKLLRYVSAVNAFVERGLRDGWENIGPEPKDDRESMADAVLSAVRAANQTGEIASLREKFPPAWEPFLSLIEKKSQALEPMTWIDDRRIALCVREPHVGPVVNWREPFVVIVDGDRIIPQPRVRFFGRSPDGKLFGLAFDEGVEVRLGWDGPRVSSFDWPSGREGMPPGFDPPYPMGPARIDQLVIFPDGQRVLLVSIDGIFVLTTAGATRLLRKEHVEWRFRGDEGAAECSLAMVHGAVSPRGDVVLIGCQNSRHLAFNGKLEHIASVGHFSEYPNFAWFSADGELAAFSSCIMHSGATIGVPVSALNGLDTPSYVADPPVRLLEERSRVNAGVARDDEWVIGDTGGYLRAFDFQGKFRWQHFVGSTITGLDLSPDGRLLAVASYAGFLCVLQLDTGTRDPFAIGTSKHRELQRWVFWRGEEGVLRW